MTLREAIQEVRDYIQDGHADRANEQETKEWFISPIIRALGWVGPRRLASENRPAQERTRMDYSLLGPRRKPLALIEAKASRRTLGDDDVTQMLNYDFHQEGVDICVLTNGVEWWLYLPREKGEPADRRFAVLDLRDNTIEAHVEILESCLSFEAITTKTAEHRAKKLLQALRDERRLREEIPRAWHRILEGPHDLLLELVKEEVEEAIGLRPSDKLVADVLRKVRSSDINVPTRSSPNTRSDTRTACRQQRESVPRVVSPSPDSRAPRTRGRSSRRNADPQGYRLWGKTYRFASWARLWLDVAEAVYARYPDDFFSRAFASDLMRGRQRSYISDSQDGLFSPRQIGNSPYFVEVNFSQNDLRRRVRDLLSIFGHDADDLEIFDSPET